MPLVGARPATLSALKEDPIRLGLSESTVSEVSRRSLAKLGVSSRADLALDREDIRQSYLQAFTEIWKNLAPRRGLPVDLKQTCPREQLDSVPENVHSLR